MTIQLSQISFPEISLSTRFAHKLRGYFGDVFREHSPLLHNHYDDGSLRYRYPLVQYKIIDRVPVLVGLQEGAKLLAELFFQIQTIKLEGRVYPVMERDISYKQCPVGIGDALNDYRFDTDWMALNQENYSHYLHADAAEQQQLLGSILTGNILSFYKGVDLFLPKEQRIMVKIRPKAEKSTLFRDNRMITFSGEFTTNALLPNGIGLGKNVSRGFGAIRAV